MATKGDTPEIEPGDYPGVTYADEHDVMLERVKLDRDRLDRGSIESERQVRSIALQVAQESTDTKDMITLLTNAKAIEDFMLSGTVPEGPSVTPKG